MNKMFAAGLALAFLATPAVAGECPKLWAQIDKALKTAELSDEHRAHVAGLRKKGEKRHKAGDHAASEAALNEALKILAGS